ncbi:MAG: YicC family protein [Candidatus Coatesbacteria bacterium]|nr:YicC family protein [Candidatus Coatesbacteria bacterium]
MISMTGYGQGTSTIDNAEIRAEMRSVNNRFLDISVRTPPGFLKYEQKIRNMVSERVSRGKVDIFVSAPSNISGTSRISVDESLVGDFVKTLRRLGQEHGLSGEVQLDTLANFRAAFSVENTSDTKDLWAPLEDCVTQSLNQMVSMRVGEGANLKAKIMEQIGSLKGDMKGLERDLSGSEQQIRDKVLDFVRKHCEMPEVDLDRLEQEVAVLLVKSDVSEEVARLYSHLSQFDSLSESSEPIGKQLTFLCQEMLREVNVIAAKSQSKEIASRTIEMKSRIEIIREQLNNIE